MENKENHIKQLESTISEFLKPLRNIPFPIAIKALTGFKVLTFEAKENKELLDLLIKASHLGGQRAFKEGIFTVRPNEAGNQIEPFVMEALREVGLNADKPLSKSGIRKVAGYPDIEVRDKSGQIIYIDCKTYNTKTKDQTFRTFYFSPSKDPKITKDAFHLLISFELDMAERKEKRVFVPISWQIYTLDKLKVQVKHEFNASNKDLYKKENLLAEGKIKL
jgi:hypothetical protein